MSITAEICDIKQAPANDEHVVWDIVGLFEDSFLAMRWTQRSLLLEEIFSYLEENIPERASVATTFARIVEELIGRVGGPGISSDEQARIYSASSAAHHQKWAARWFADRQE